MKLIPMMMLITSAFSHTPVKYESKSYSPAAFSLVPLASFSVSLLPFASVPFLACYERVHVCVVSW